MEENHNENNENNKRKIGRPPLNPAKRKQKPPPNPIGRPRKSEPGESSAKHERKNDDCKKALEESTAALQNNMKIMTEVVMMLASVDFTSFKDKIRAEYKADINDVYHRLNAKLDKIANNTNVNGNKFTL